MFVLSLCERAQLWGCSLGRALLLYVCVFSVWGMVSRSWKFWCGVPDTRASCTSVWSCFLFVHVADERVCLICALLSSLVLAPPCTWLLVYLPNLLSLITILISFPIYSLFVLCLVSVRCGCYRPVLPGCFSLTGSCLFFVTNKSHLYSLHP